MDLVRWMSLRGANQSRRMWLRGTKQSSQMSLRGTKQSRRIKDIPSTFFMDLPAVFKSLDLVRACIQALIEDAPALANGESGFAEMTIYNIHLAVHEIMTNIIEHAYEDVPTGRIYLTLIFDPSQSCLTIEMDDQGISFDPARIRLPDLNNAQEHGYGLFLTKKLMDIVEYSSTQSGNHWRLVKNLLPERED